MKKDKIGNPDNMKRVDRIILNGLVGDVPTNDENYSTIGVLYIDRKVTFEGEEIVTHARGFALTKEMEDKTGWKDCYARVRFVTGNSPIDPTKVEETIIESLFGETESKYYHTYSDLTGYLWTTEDFIVGGHDLRKILNSHRGEYIHMEIELYKEIKEENKK